MADAVIRCIFAGQDMAATPEYRATIGAPPVVAPAQPSERERITAMPPKAMPPIKPVLSPSGRPAGFGQGAMTTAERETIFELCKGFQKDFKQSRSTKCYPMPGINNCAVVALAIERCTLAGWDMSP